MTSKLIYQARISSMLRDTSMNSDQQNLDQNENFVHVNQCKDLADNNNFYSLEQNAINNKLEEILPVLQPFQHAYTNLAPVPDLLDGPSPIVQTKQGDPLAFTRYKTRSIKNDDQALIQRLNTLQSEQNNEFVDPQYSSSQTWDQQALGQAPIIVDLVEQSDNENDEVVDQKETKTLTDVVNKLNSKGSNLKTSQRSKLRGQIGVTQKRTHTLDVIALQKSIRQDEFAEPDTSNGSSVAETNEAKALNPFEFGQQLQQMEFNEDFLNELGNDSFESQKLDQAEARQNLGAAQPKQAAQTLSQQMLQLSGFKPAHMHLFATAREEFRNEYSSGAENSQKLEDSLKKSSKTRDQPASTFGKQKAQNIADSQTRKRLQPDQTRAMSQDQKAGSSQKLVSRDSASTSMNQQALQKVPNMPGAQENLQMSTKTMNLSSTLSHRLGKLTICRPFDLSDLEHDGQKLKNELKSKTMNFGQKPFGEGQNYGLLEDNLMQTHSQRMMEASISLFDPAQKLFRQVGQLSLEEHLQQHQIVYRQVCGTFQQSAQQIISFEDAFIQITTKKRNSRLGKPVISSPLVRSVYQLSGSSLASNQLKTSPQLQTNAIKSKNTFLRNSSIFNSQISSGFVQSCAYLTNELNQSVRRENYDFHFQPRSSQPKPSVSLDDLIENEERSQVSKFRFKLTRIFSESTPYRLAQTCQTRGVFEPGIALAQVISGDFRVDASIPNIKYKYCQDYYKLISDEQSSKKQVRSQLLNELAVNDAFFVNFTSICGRAGATDLEHCFGLLQWIVQERW